MPTRRFPKTIATRRCVRKTAEFPRELDVFRLRVFTELSQQKSVTVSCKNVLRYASQNYERWNIQFAFSIHAGVISGRDILALSRDWFIQLDICIREDVVWCSFFFFSFT